MCVDYLWKSERYELIAEINKPVIAVFEKRRDFKVHRLFIVGLLKKHEGTCSSTVCLCVCPIAVIGAVLRHSPLIPEGDRGGALRETSVWSVLSRGFLWTGETLNHSKTLLKSYLALFLIWEFKPLTYSHQMRKCLKKVFSH